MFPARALEIHGVPQPHAQRNPPTNSFPDLNHMPNDDSAFQSRDSKIEAVNCPLKK
jgi:hypothetical protein